MSKARTWIGEKSVATADATCTPIAGSFVGFQRACIGPRCALVLAVSAGLTMLCPSPLRAGPDPGQIELADLDGSNGFSLDGEAQNDRSGRSVSAAGDINGDGVDDVIIGAFLADPNGNASGRSYVVFGSTNGFASPIALSTLNGSNGFVLNGEVEADRAGWSVAAAGDVNGDAIDDLIIGAIFASPNGNRSGRSYVVFGSDQGFSSPFELTALNGSNGFVLNGEALDDESGQSVSGAGDINGDGIDDLIIGAPFADPNGTDSGRSYVVFGSENAFSNPFELSSLNGSNGVMIDGEAADDYSGASVSAAGDINGDGIDDLAIGAFFADPNGNASGRSYVVFGSASGFSSPLNLSSLNGSNGFALNGESAGNQSGKSLSGAGDINGDGIGDLIIGAARTDPDGNESGRSYVVFGSADGFPGSLDLSSLDGSSGFILDGDGPLDRFGTSVSAAGDFNFDGLDDLIVGADSADGSGNASGRSYVVFGSDDPFSNPFSVSMINGLNGVVLNGELMNDMSGESVSGSVDINGDGIDDVIIGARGADPNGSSSGRTYVVFGQRGDLIFDDRFEGTPARRSRP